MKTTRPLLPGILAALAFHPSGLAEEAPQAAYLNVVNLVALREPTRISLGAFALNEGKPMAPGEGSGLLAIRPGSHPFTLENPAAKPSTVSGSLDLEHGRTVAVICYAETEPDGDGNEGHEVKLRYSVLVEGERSGPRLSLVSLLREPFVGVEISGEPATLERNRARGSPVKLGDAVRVVHRGRLLADWEIAKPLHYLGFLYEHPDSGEVELSLIQNERLEYQAPLEGRREEDDGG